MSDSKKEMKNKLPYFLETIPDFKKIYGNKEGFFYIYNAYFEVPKEWQKKVKMNYIQEDGIIVYVLKKK
jgi:hypothetical protein